MSFNRNSYTAITRNNYEEQFLLYVDGELSPEAMTEVEQFAALHPDLNEELQLLLETRLDSEPVSFGDLSVLSAEHMRHNLHEEELLLYIDGELDPARQAGLQTSLQKDPALRIQLASLQSLKLDASDKITCPFKEELYRREKERRPAFAWWRVAAVFLLLGAGTLVWRNARTDTGSPAPGTTAFVGFKSIHKIAPVQQNAGPADVLITSTGLRPALNDISALPEFGGKSQAKKRASKLTPQPADKSTQEIAFQPKPDPRDRKEIVEAERATQTQNAQRIDVIASTHNNLVDKKLGTDPVTIAALPAYNLLNTANTPEATTAVVREEGKQSSVRGFLRKASRFIEKRTGIKTTNDDNQLVLGGVAINLK
jgi:anti-sigma factor RsiW